MIDASFVLAPKQRNTREENEKIKKERVKNYGMISHKRKIIKILMHVGHKREDRTILATRLMLK